MSVSTDVRILDGKRHAAELVAEAGERARSLARPPGLTVVLVGEDPASKVYVRNKEKAAASASVRAETLRLPASASLAEIEAAIDELNRREDVDGILVQLPLPRPAETERILDRIDARKDVDGFHPENVGRLWSGRPRFVPCTPSGVIEMLRREQIPLAGCRAVVLGRSNIVGKPMAALLMMENATVTVCHSKTRDLEATCRQADLLVAAIGKPGFVGPEFVKDGAVVVDVGINPLTEAARVERFFPGDAGRRGELERRGQTLIGDVDYVRVAPKASAITPVPGGVGPLTVAMLVRNTVLAAELRQRGAA